LSGIWKDQKSADPCKLRMGKLLTAEGGKAITEIDYNWLVNLRERMVATWGIKPSTVNRYMAMISKALTEAHKRGRLAAMPKVPYAREPKGKLRWLTRDEEARLMAACGDIWTVPEAEKMRNLLVALLDTGGRLSEVLGVRQTFCWKNAEQVTFLDTKNGSSRSVPLTGRAIAALACLPDWTNKFATDRFTRLRNHCELPDVSLHTMRHTCASRLVQGGMDLYRVMTWLGHSSINVTQRYAHLAPTSLAHGADLLAQFAEVDTNRLSSNRSVPPVAALRLVKS
jgi:integrase